MVARVASRRIFLVGPMGSGKTTIGSHIARAMGLPFVDSDEEIESRTGADIALIFEIEGEAGFRAREKRVIEELTQREDLVLATGGGAILDETNRRCLSERGFVVYLKSGVETLLRRLRHDTTRPLLRNGDPAVTLRRIMAVRGPLYEATADVIIETGKQPVKQLVKKILSQIP